jgi:hypothetical protein
MFQNPSETEVFGKEIKLCVLLKKIGLSHNQKNCAVMF